MKVYLAPAKTPRPIVVKLNQTSVNVVRSPEIAAHAPADGYAEQGVENGRKHAGTIGCGAGCRACTYGQCRQTCQPATRMTR